MTFDLTSLHKLNTHVRIKSSGMCCEMYFVNYELQTLSNVVTLCNVVTLLLLSKVVTRLLLSNVVTLLQWLPSSWYVLIFFFFFTIARCLQVMAKYCILAK